MDDLLERHKEATKLRLADGTQTYLRADQLRPSSLNPRFDLGDLTELTESIASVGILQPLVVTPEGEHYKLVTGHRRFAAGKAAGVKDFPVVIRDLDDAQCQEAMLIENVHRRDLTPVEEAAAYVRLMKQHGYTQRELGGKVGRTQAHISRRLAILRLPKQMVDAVHKGEVGVDEALGYGEHKTGIPRANIAKPAFAKPRMCELERHRSHDPDGCEVARSLLAPT